MKDFRKAFKKLVKKGKDTSVDYAALAIMKAMTAKSNESKVQIASNILESMFSRVTNKVKLANGFHANRGMISAVCGLERSTFVAECLENEWERNLFFTIVDAIYFSLRTTGQPVHKKYIYFFVRDDLSPSYQAVQLAHAAWEAQYYVGKDGLHDVNFVVCVETKENVETLAEKYKGFREPDMNNEVTCAYTPIIPYENKIIFADYKLLNLPEKTSILQNNSYERVKVKTGLNFGNVPDSSRVEAI